MLNIILNIVGVILIIYSLYSILKIYRKEEEKLDMEIFNELEKLDKQGSFSSLIDEKLDESNDIQKRAYIKKEEIIDERSIKESSTLKKEDIKFKDLSTGLVKDIRNTNYTENINPIHKKVLELKNIGLTNEEISKKLDRSVREIDIILKLNER